MARMSATTIEMPSESRTDKATEPDSGTSAGPIGRLAVAPPS